MGSKTVLSVWEVGFLLNVLTDPEGYSTGSFWSPADLAREAALLSKLRAAFNRSEA